MADVHARLNQWRQARKRGEVAGEDPIAPVAADLAREASLLCFDEFSVRDIADAMILSRLFSALFAAGVVVVATSNVAPDDLYKDGLNRALFLPFITLIKQRLDVVELDARTDYRLEKLKRAPVYYTPLGPKADAALDAAFLTLTGHERGEPMQIELLGRHLDVPQAIDGVARFDFDALCRRPLGAADYLKLAQRFHTLVLDHIPVIGASERNEAKRFIILIDALYDMRVKLIASAAGEPETLYSAAEGAEAFEFARTASRLHRNALDRVPRAAARARQRSASGRSRRHRGDMRRKASAGHGHRDTLRFDPGSILALPRCTASAGWRSRRGQTGDRSPTRERGRSRSRLRRRKEKWPTSFRHGSLRL